MLPTSLFNQSVTLYTTSSYTEFGRERLSAGTICKVRFQPTTKTMLLPNGTVKQVDAIVYFAPDVEIEVEDKVRYSGVDYKVVGKSEGVDGQGNTNHIKVQLAVWPT